MRGTVVWAWRLGFWGLVVGWAWGLAAQEIVSSDSFQPRVQLAPFGVPTAPKPAAPGDTVRNLQGSFRLLLALPPFLGPEIRLDLEAQYTNGAPMPDLGDAPGLPKAALTGSEGVLFRRQSDKPLDEGYLRYLSEEIVALADPRAARAYPRSAAEDEACTRCNPGDEGVGANAREILSGDVLKVRFPAEIRTRLAQVYSRAKLDEAELAISSVRWELVPARRQEPRLSPSLGSGDVAPGTLLASGEQSHTAVDLMVKTRGLDFIFTRTYRSQTIGNGPLGPGWEHNFMERLRELPNGDVDYFDGRGRRETFTRDRSEANALVAPKGRFERLSRDQAGFLLTLPSNERHRFDRSGRLIALYSPTAYDVDSENPMKLQWDWNGRLASVVDSTNRSYDFQYDDDGRVTQLRDFSGRVVKYTYDEQGRLVKVTSPKITVGASQFPEGLTTEYRYAGPSGDLAGQLNTRDNLASIQDPKGQTWLTLTYTDEDGDGRADEVSGQQWGSGSLSIATSADGGSTTVTDRRGNRFQYQHNPAGQPTRIEDPTGAVTQMTYDDEGRLTSRTEPLGRITTYTYTSGSDRLSLGDVLTVTVIPDGRGANGSASALTTTFEYDTLTHRPTKITDPRGVVTEITRHASGVPTEVREAVGSPAERSTTYELNQYAQVTRQVDPRGRATVYTYGASGDTEGYLTGITQDSGGLDLTRSFELDLRGNVLVTTDSRGVQHTSTYNEVDWLVASIESSGASSDGAGPLAVSSSYLFDANGNVTEEQRESGESGGFTVSRYTYGVLDETLSASRQIGAESFASETYIYDANLNLVGFVGPSGQRRDTVYDARNLPLVATLGAGSPVAVTQSYSYNPDGERTALLDGRGKLWRFEQDGYGRSMRQFDPLGNFSESQYDSGHNPTTFRSIDGASGRKLAEAFASYDPLNRRVESSQQLWVEDGEVPQSLSTTFTYDAAGNLVGTVDPLGRATQYQVDGVGRVVATIDAAGNRTERVLDGNGNVVTQITHEVQPNGTPVSVVEHTQYDSLNRPIEIRDGLGNVTRLFYDARGNLRQEVSPDGFLTEHFYDGLNRRIKTVLPEGVSVENGYDDAGRLITYKDALGNITRYSYDALDRLTETLWPDGTRHTRTYDAGGNVIEVLDPNGTRIVQSYDDAGRLATRTVEPAPGVVGPTAETYAYDGLSRLVESNSGGVISRYTYDSLSRRVREETLGRAVELELDLLGNARSVRYPSGKVLSQSYDGLNRLTAVTDSGGSTPEVEYHYRGPSLLAEKTFGNGVSMRYEYDASRRPVAIEGLGPSGRTVYGEQLAWSARGLKSARTRLDLNSAGQAFGYDGLGRVTESAVMAGAAEATGNNAPAPNLLGLPELERMTYDTAQNLLAIAETEEGIQREIPLPLDLSGRNRPASVGGVPLGWDANGNLIAKGDLRFAYDFKNRLTRVETAAGAELARYEYDASNRRVRKLLPSGTVLETAWHGWQAIEEYEDGVLTERRTFGLGLDEAVKVEIGRDNLDISYVPVYDSSGNVAALLDAAGKPVERYVYSTYGRRTILADLTPPTIEQVRMVGGELWLESSEEVLLEAILEAIGDGALTLTNTATSQVLTLTAEQPIREGKQAGRRVVLALGSPPAAGASVELSIQSEAWTDTFLNHLAEVYTLAFSWPAEDTVLADHAPPRVEQVSVRGGRVEIELSEEVPPAALAAVSVNNTALTWTASDNRYRWQSVEVLDPGSFEVEVSTTLTDLAGTALASEHRSSFTLTPNNSDQLVFRTRDPRELEESSLGNVTGFQGRPVDLETGLLYFRNRYYDPEMGRFVTADPLSYLDGPNVYAAFGNGPVNVGDPMGLYQLDLHFYGVYYLARAVGFGSQQALRIALGSQFPDDYGASRPEGIGNNLRRTQQIAALHFSLPRDQKVERNNRVARAAVHLAAKSRDLARLGVALHTFADSYSHEGFSLSHDDDNRRAGSFMRPNYGHADAEHGGHGPDLPFLDQAKAIEALEGILALLAGAFEEIYGKPALRHSLGVLREDVAAAVRKPVEDEGLRAVFWRGLIAVEFGEVISYDRDNPPEDLSDALEAHVQAIIALSREVGQ